MSFKVYMIVVGENLPLIISEDPKPPRPPPRAIFAIFSPSLTNLKTILSPVFAAELPLVSSTA